LAEFVLELELLLPVALSPPLPPERDPPFGGGVGCTTAAPVFALVVGASAKKNETNPVAKRQKRTGIRSFFIESSTMFD
jgi:hypothetical protein